MPIEDALRAWAAQRLDIPVSDISNVEFEETDEYWYSDITCDPATKGATVWLTPEATQRTWVGTMWIDLDGLDFGELIREILDFAHDNVSVTA
jgi:hypothetical protein